MSLVLWIIFGALAGWIASFLMGSNVNVWLNILMGVIGAVIGGFVMNLFGASGVTGFNFYSLFVAVIGAVILIALSRAMTRSTVL